jgi:Do/DeqQ family serine protease
MGLCGAIPFASVDAGGPSQTARESSAAPEELTAATFRQVAQAQAPAVVNIRTESRDRARATLQLPPGVPFAPPWLRPRNDERQLTVGAGSGFIIDGAGLVLTNHHVVDDATSIEVRLYGEDEIAYAAKVIGRDPLTDSALIQLVDKPAAPLPTVVLGSSAALQPGDWVLAIGNPFNLAHTVTVGVVSAVARPFLIAEGRSQEVIQTDAAINPGNSGGPLMNLRGEVVGINTAIMNNGSNGNVGIGFAIPIDIVRGVLPQLRRGDARRGRLGVHTTRVPAAAVDEFGLSSRRGALVTSVDAASPAARGGVQPGDVVLEYNGTEIRSPAALSRLVADTVPGTTVPIVVLRDKSRRALRVEVDRLTFGAQEIDGLAQGFGLRLRDLADADAARLQLPAGRDAVVVAAVEAGSSAMRGGIRPGDAILEIGRDPVGTTADAVRRLETVAPEGTALLLVWRNGNELFLTVRRE